MKIHLRLEYKSPSHNRFTVFVNGANAGVLCMTPEETVWFEALLFAGCNEVGEPEDEIQESTREGL